MKTRVCLKYFVHDCRPSKKLIEGNEDLSYDISRNVTDELFSEDIVISFDTFKSKFKEKLSENDIEVSLINLKITIESGLPNFKFRQQNEWLMLYISLLKVETTLSSKLEEVQNVESPDIATNNCPLAIRNELKNCPYKTESLPNKKELDFDKFDILTKLFMFLKTLLQCENKYRLNHLMSPFCQDLFYFSTSCKYINS